MVGEKIVREYAADMTAYYEATHGFVPVQFEKYLRKAVRKGVDLMRAPYEELRQVAEHQQCVSMDRYFRNEALEKQLTPAKSLIHKLLITCWERGITTNVTVDATRFLREVM